MACEDNPVPLACALPPGELLRRRGEIVQSLFQHALQVRELTAGLEFVFAGEAALIAALMDFIRFERDCCRFLSFELIFEPEQGPVRLRILGPPEATPVIREMFLLYFSS